MIFVSKASIASALMLGVAALSSADDAFAQTPQQAPTSARTIDDVIGDLALPVGRTASYFNSATKTAVRESCVKNESNTAVTCTDDVMSVRAQMRVRQSFTVTLESGGQISIFARSGAPQEWNPATNRLFNTTMGEASNATWNRSSPLATMASDGTHVLQNDVLQLNKTGDASVSGLSIIPVTPSRGIAVSLGFDRSAASVTLGTMQVIKPGEIDPNFGVSRMFNAYDKDYYKLDKDDLGGRDRAYALRP